MDIVVYIKGGENESLKYAIRTWCRYLQFNHLCVVGGPKPSWLVPDIYIEHPTVKAKMLQCYENLCLAMDDDRISDDVLLMMDDIFLLRPTIWDKNYHRGTLEEHYVRSRKQYGDTLYGDQLKFTDKVMSQYCEAPLSFEEHAPFLCTRHLMQQALSIVKQHSIEETLWRSVYGNLYCKDTEFKPDIKLQTSSDTFANSDVVISTSGRAFHKGAGDIIRNWFPTPSKYERGV